MGDQTNQQGPAQPDPKNPTNQQGPKQPDPKNPMEATPPSIGDVLKTGVLPFDKYLFPFQDGTDLRAWMRDLPDTLSASLVQIYDKTLGSVIQDLQTRQFDGTTPGQRAILEQYQGVGAAKDTTLRFITEENSPFIDKLIADDLRMKALAALNKELPDYGSRLGDNAKTLVVDLLWKTFPNVMTTIDRSLVGAKKAFKAPMEHQKAPGPAGDNTVVVLDGSILDSDHVLPQPSDRQAASDFLKNRSDGTQAPAPPGPPVEVKSTNKPGFSLKTALNVDALKLAQYPKRGKAFKEWTLGAELSDKIDTKDITIQLKIAPSLVAKLSGMPKAAGTDQVFNIHRYGSANVDGSVNVLIKGYAALNISGKADMNIRDPKQIDYSVQASLELGGVPDKLISQIRGWKAAGDTVGDLTREQLRNKQLGDDVPDPKPPPKAPELPADPTNPSGKGFEKLEKDAAEHIGPPIELPPPEKPTKHN